jgi:hypothetical protein
MDHREAWLSEISDMEIDVSIYDENGNEVWEPIGFASKKFSDAAMRWDAFKKEAYALYFGVHHFAYYLRGKAFILETDHRNLLWIEKSEVPMVVRWRVFLQSFTMYIRHIPGTKNLVADWLSRMVALLFNMSLEEFLAEGEKYADISCLLSLIMCRDEDCEELAAVPSVQMPEVRVQERVSDPKEDV